MNEQSLLRAVEIALLDGDGSCRDINFSEYISTAGAVGILNFLSSAWKLSQATNGNGKEIPFAELSRTLNRESGSLSTRWEGGSNPSQVQAYFFWSATDEVFCELTFFPQDCDRASFTVDGFLLMLRKLVSVAQSKEYYVRFENASWRHGEPTKYNDVILSHKTFPLDR